MFMLILMRDTNQNKCPKTTLKFKTILGNNVKNQNNYTRTIPKIVAQLMLKI
jgi:hypothetical protein